MVKIKEIDSKIYKISELKDDVFISPFYIFDLAESIGLEQISEARAGVKLKIHEMWVTALFSLGLGKSKGFINPEFYVACVADSNPDTRLLIVDHGKHDPKSMIGLESCEITRHGSLSNDLSDRLKDKMGKFYRTGTCIIVWINKKDTITAAEVDKCVRSHNSRAFNIFLMYFTPNTVELMPLSTMRPSEEGIDWREVKLIPFQYREEERAFKNYHAAIELKSGPDINDKQTSIKDWTFIKNLQLLAE